MTELKVKSLLKTYPIIMGSNIISLFPLYANLERKILIVFDKNVDMYFINKISSMCKKSYLYPFDSSEDNKNINTVIKIIDVLNNYNFTPSDALLYIGGGVVGDVVSFTASIYKRGIEYYAFATTVISQLDSSIGGKTGVNYNNTKNVIGTFYPPSLVISDFDTLKTLNKRQVSNGIIEALKMGIIFDEEIVDLIYNKDPYQNIDKIIEKSIKIKKDVVEKDERDNNQRRLLNYGHTIGHCIEMVNKDTLLHGESVGYGMLCFSSLKVRKIIKECLLKLDIPPLLNIDKEKIISLLKSDKKSKGNTISCIEVNDIKDFEIKNYTLDEISNRIDVLKEIL